MARFEAYQDNAKQWRWRLVADNGRIMADSAEGYDSIGNAHRAAKRVAELVSKAEIVEEEK